MLRRILKLWTMWIKGGHKGSWKFIFRVSQNGSTFLKKMKHPSWKAKEKRSQQKRRQALNSWLSLRRGICGGNLWQLWGQIRFIIVRRRRWLWRQCRQRWFAEAIAWEAEADAFHGRGSKRVWTGPRPGAESNVWNIMRNLSLGCPERWCRFVKVFAGGKVCSWGELQHSCNGTQATRHVKDSLIIGSWNYTFENWIYVVLSTVRTLKVGFVFMWKVGSHEAIPSH